ncbi:hypothetical protein BDA96_04G298900 [Sorghum bicolor]|uniref:Uncharacterized protein n=2 Tax=Sorghum bicolor TaxID=4558 RepID=A0A921R950_SORBI|nr:hypothetical protein SORBI_3004G280600 [Sorghum bicolor]KAG0534667.1 hypothetical protein BDA96_04G298900 [Sorghum bicolor]
MAASEACMCCQLLPPPCAMCSVASIDAIASSLARSLPPFYCTSLRCEYCAGLGVCGVGGKEATYVPASRQLSRLWIDFTNYLAICRAWVQFFLQWDGSET